MAETKSARLKREAAEKAAAEQEAASPAEETTPVHDEVKRNQATADDTNAALPEGAVEVDPENPDAVNVTNPEHLEDDDPLSLVGDFVDEDGDGVDDRKQGGTD